MNQRWHVKSNYSISQCRARPGECLYDNEDNHYSDFESALKALHKKLSQDSSLLEKARIGKRIKRYREVRASIEEVLFQMGEKGGYVERKSFPLHQQALVAHLMQKANQRVTDEDFYAIAAGEKDPSPYIVEELEKDYQLSDDLWRQINNIFWVKNSQELRILNERLTKRLEKAAAAVPSKAIAYEPLIQGFSPMGNLSNLNDEELKSFYSDEYSAHLALAIFDRDPRRFRFWEASSSLDWDGDDTGVYSSVHFFAEDTRKNVFIDVFGRFDSPRKLMEGWEDFTNDATLRFTRFNARSKIMNLLTEQAFHETYIYDANYVVERFRLL